MKTLVTGMGRTGGHSMTDLFTKLGLQNSYHERGLGMLQHEMLVYSLDAIPYDTFINMSTWAQAVRGDYFETSWPMSNMIMLARKYVKDLNIIIMLRDLTDYANSNRAHRSRIHLDQSVDDIANLWFYRCHFMCDQIEMMGYKPYLMTLDGYRDGKYNNFLLDLYGLNNEKNRQIMNDDIKKKTNHVVDYKREPIHKGIYARCCEAQERLKGLTNPL